MKNAKRWTDYLPHDVYIRLEECNTTKTDLPILVNAKWNWAKDTGHYDSYTKEDFLLDVLELLDCNGLADVTELTLEDWQKLTK